MFPIASNSDDEKLYVDDVFSTYLYTGNGSTQTINNGIDLAGKGGMVWCKKRSAADNHFLQDTIQGNAKYLQSDSTNPAGGTTGVSFLSTGYSMDSSADMNISPNTYASWTFRKAAKFFDVVTYTGNGTADRDVPHNLNCEIGLAIIKATSTTGDWYIYHNYCGWTGGQDTATGLRLNSTDSDGGTSVGPLSTNKLLKLGSYKDGVTNINGVTYVAYLFAHDTSSTGIIQCGSCTINIGSETTVNLGWEPQWVLMKRTDGVGGWFLFDTMRGMAVSGATAFLYANSTAAEDVSTAGGTTYLVPTATGFATNGFLTAGNYIYMAIRRPNKPPTTGTQVYIPLAANNLVNTINTTNFPIDLQWYGNRVGNVENIATVDRLRGVATTGTQQQNYLKTASSGAEINSGGSSYTNSWNNTGFKTSAAADGADAVYWNFKRAPGFFDEVCYTGTGSAMTVAHNLTVAPEFIIVKNRNNVNNWPTYSAYVVQEAQYRINLNSTNGASPSGESVWGATPTTVPNMTSTTFSLGTEGKVNTSLYTYVAYLFATLAGISKVGSYTGNGSTGQAIACGFSAGARFVLIRRSDINGGNWYTFDSARGLTSVSSPYLLLNSTAAEVTGNNGVYASTGGFTLGSTASTTTNINGASYIFLAVS